MEELKYIAMGFIWIGLTIVYLFIFLKLSAWFVMDYLGLDDADTLTISLMLLFAIGLSMGTAYVLIKLGLLPLSFGRV
jgi:hypothetical protein